jgi:hypothetical protein
VDANAGPINPSFVQSEIQTDFTGDLTIYYDPNNLDNTYLDDLNYSFGNGGELEAEAVPEPSVLIMVLFGGLAAFGFRNSRLFAGFSDANEFSIRNVCRTFPR